MSLYPKVCGYSIQALGYLLNTEKELVGASEIAEETGVPKPMLSQILHKLVKSGLILGKRGKGGGFALNCDPSKVTFWDVIETVSRGDELPECLFDMDIEEAESCCPTFSFWQEHRKHIIKRLKETNLLSLRAVSVGTITDPIGWAI